MHRHWLCFGVVGVTLFLTACGGQTSADRTVLAATVRPAGRVAPAQNAQKRTVRASGTIQPVNAVTVQAPNLYGQQPRMVLTALIENGSRVKKGDDLAEFDRVQQLDAARESQAKFEDLGHQVVQRIALNRAETE